MRLTTRANELVRFGVTGMANTGTTYGLYLLLIRFMPYGTAYMVVYIFGLLVSYVVNSKFVFSVKMSWLKLLVYPTVYAVQYIFNKSTLNLLVYSLRVPEVYAPLLVTVLSIPVTYLISRSVLRMRLHR